MDTLTVQTSAVNSQSFNSTNSAKSRQIDSFAELGCAFALLNGKQPVDDNWQNLPYSAEAAKAHRGNIGVHAGRHSNRLVWIDVDSNGPQFLDTFPQLKDSLQVAHANDPDRVKVAVRVDRLPRSTRWKPEKKQPPKAELLSTGRQAAVIGIHPSGVPYRNNGKMPIELTIGQLSAIWRHWTGLELPDPTAPKATQQAKVVQTTDPNSLLGRVKAFWTAYGVFEHFDRIGDTKAEPNGDLRLLGQGGLLVGDPAGSTPWRWYCHSDDRGGDQLDAWAYCTNRHLNKETFPIILAEMASAAGIQAEPDKVQMTIEIVNQETGEIHTEQRLMSVPDAIALLIQKFAAPDAFPRGRNMRYDRAVMFALLEKMRVVGRICAVHFDCRSMATEINIDKTTASKTLRRLASYGYIQRQAGLPWFTGDLPEDDKLVANMHEAYSWGLTADVCIARTHCPTGTVTGADVAVCPRYAYIDPDILRDYGDHDAFARGAKIADDDLSLGPAAREVIATLEVANEQTYAEIASNTGMSRATAGKKAQALAAYGLVELYKEGRTTIVYLVDNWRDRLDAIWTRLNTFCRNLRRRCYYLTQRIDRIMNSLSGVTSGFLHKALSELLDHYRQGLFQTNQRIGELSALRG